MSELRIGTRGSDLALTQTRLVIELLRNLDAPDVSDVDVEEVILRTHGDEHPTQAMTEHDWPVGGFVGTIERALLAGEIDIAVHSLKDLPTEPTPGLIIAAIPARAPAHDVLVLDRPAALEALPPGLRIGTSSPRRMAQLRQLGVTTCVPLRGNVPRRLEQVGRELDGVVLAAAGLDRLGLRPAHGIDLPLDRIPCAPGQGALAVQCREHDRDVVKLLRMTDDEPTRCAVETERAVLRALGAGCQTPLGAYAHLERDVIHLTAQLYSNDGKRCAIHTHQGDDPIELGSAMADELRTMLERGGGQ